jgi:hypothetical protein
MNEFNIPLNILNRISKYKINKKLKGITLMSENGEIVGQEIDNNNRMIYIIKDNGKLRMKYAQEVKVSVSSPKASVDIVIVKKSS